MAQDSSPGAGQNTVVHRLFEEQVRRTPEATAVTCGPDRLSYAELDARANQLAAALRARALPPGKTVAVSLGRTPELLVAILAVLKAGGAYVPLEPTAPESLLRHVLATARPFAVLTTESHRVRIADATDAAVICLDSDAAEIERQSAGPVHAAVRPQDLACVFFTSGSTGLPKGAMVEHGNLVGAFQGWQEVFAFTPEDRHLQSTTFEFDVFTADWLRALCSGGTLVMAQRNFTLDRTARIAELHALILSEGITVIGSSVLMARRLADHLRQMDAGLGQVRLLLIGADKWYLDEQLALQEHLGAGVRVVNIYGVAEAGIDCAYFDASVPLTGPPEQPGRISIIGRPFPGVRLTLLTRKGYAVPVGEPGELWLGGPGVGRGYLGDQSLTRARFEPARFGTDPEKSRGYRTGDAAILRRDGLLEYVGRLDPSPDPYYALALARVEGLVRDQPGVREAVVADIRVPEGTSARVAYIVVANDGPVLEPGAIRATVNRESSETSATSPGEPGSLRLDAVVPLPALPRTRVGKIDRTGLPLPAAGIGAASPAALRGSGKGSWSGARMAGSLKAPGLATGPAPARAGMWLVSTVFFSIFALLLTNAFWPGSNDLSQVPGDWHLPFRVLYACEDIAFGYGVTFLFLGGQLLRRFDAPRGRTRAAHLSIVWLFAAWWPQDNSYRTTDPAAWGAQTALVYGFNIALMLAAWLVVRFLAAARSTR